MDDAAQKLSVQRTQDSFFIYKKTVASKIAGLSRKSERLAIYSSAISSLSAVIDVNYDPSWIASTSVPLPDIVLSSGSDPAQIKDPVERSEAIADRKALSAKIEQHNLQKLLREELDTIIASSLLEADASGSDDSDLILRKLKDSGLSGAEGIAILKAKAMMGTAANSFNKAPHPVGGAAVPK